MSGKQFFYIVLITFTTLMVWVILDIVHSRSQVQPDSKIQQLMEPVNPTFDQDTINGL